VPGGPDWDRRASVPRLPGAARETGVPYGGTTCGHLGTRLIRPSTRYSSGWRRSATDSVLRSAARAVMRGMWGAAAPVIHARSAALSTRMTATSSYPALPRAKDAVEALDKTPLSVDPLSGPARTRSRHLLSAPLPQICRPGRHGRDQSGRAIRRRPPAAAQAGAVTQPGSSRSSVASGSEPWPSTWSWNSRRSNREPSRAVSWRRSCSIARWPSL
jgi:hypothetical protein